MKEQLISVYENTEKKITENPNRVKITFINGPKVEILGNNKIKYYIEFIDNDTQKTIHSGYIENNQWIKANREWYTNWRIIIMQENKKEIIINHKLNLLNKDVYISFESKSLGDTLAWWPYVRKFKEKHNCNIIVSTFWNKFFESINKDLKFIEPGQTVENITAQYNLGIFENGYSNLNLNKNDTRKEPLQKIACDLLGLEYEEIKPEIKIPNRLPTIKGKYVCIAEHGTSQSKYWNNTYGWQNVVNHLNSIGYKVVVISKEKTKLNNIIDKTGDHSIEDRIVQLINAEFFIGISSGLSWLAWTVGIPVIMISGHTQPWYEFNCNRIFNESVCNGCWHTHEFDKGNWNWCPENKKFECTREIYSDVVINEINKIINKNSDYMFYVNDKIEPIDMLESNRGFSWNNWKNYKPYNVMFHEIFNDVSYQYDKCKIEKDDVVLDIGANIGVFERFCILNGASKVYCFEPEPNNFKFLQKNISSKSICENVIIDEYIGYSTLYLDSTSGGHSVINNNINNTKTGDVITTECITLNNIIEKYNIDKIDFMKVDAEGAELKIFNGISNDNLKKINKISMEYHDMIFNFDNNLKQKFVDRLTRLGFNSNIHIVTTHLTLMYFWR